MIVMLKYWDTGKSMFAYNEPTSAIDRIKINKLTTAGFPIFDLSTEMVEGVARRRAGEFNIEFSFLQKDVSHMGHKIEDFLTKKPPGSPFFVTDRTFKYLFAMQHEGFTFWGTFKSEDIEKDFTYSQGRYHASFYVRDGLQEMSEYADTLTSKFPITHLDNLTFEAYMNMHCFDFAPLMYLPNHVGGPTFAQRIGNSSVVFAGNVYDIPPQYTDWQTVSRWETFKGLAQGLGFDYELELRYNNLDELYNWYTRIPREHFKLRIFWKSDIASENPITLTRAKEHREITIAKTKKYLFMGYRHAIFTRLPNGATTPQYTGIRGILFDGTNIIDSDSGDNYNGGNSYPSYNFFLRTSNAGHAPFNPATTLLYITGNGQYTKYDDIEINEIPLKLYSHPGFGGGFAVAGAIAYARMFNCTGHNFLPIQRYVVNSYKRYIVSSGIKGKRLRLKLSDCPGIRLYKHIKLDDGDGLQSYEGNAIRDIDLQRKTILCEATQL